FPTTVQIKASAPKDWRLKSTLPAPPSRSSLLLTETTGTGASGEIRSTLPHTEESNITSPTTNTLNLLNDSKIFSIEFMKKSKHLMGGLTGSTYGNQGLPTQSVFTDS